MIPDSFFTWEALGTYAGATVAVMIVVQFTKELPGIVQIPTRAWAYLVSALLLVLSALFSGQPITPAMIILCFVNAVIVAMAACGGYDTLHSEKK